MTPRLALDETAMNTAPGPLLAGRFRGVPALCERLADFVATVAYRPVRLARLALDTVR